MHSRSATGSEGGAIALVRGRLCLAESVCSHNRAASGGCVAAQPLAYQDEALIRLRGTMFEGNEALQGGAVFANHVALDVDDCLFQTNKAVNQVWPGVRPVPSCD